MSDHENIVEIREALADLVEAIHLQTAMMARIAVRDSSEPLANAESLLFDAERLRYDFNGKGR